jgi:hypothetical protein
VDSASKNEEPHPGAAVSVVEPWPWPPEICTLQQKHVLLCSPSRRLLGQPHDEGAATARVSF